MIETSIWYHLEELLLLISRQHIYFLLHFFDVHRFGLALVFVVHDRLCLFDLFNWLVLSLFLLLDRSWLCVTRLSLLQFGYCQRLAGQSFKLRYECIFKLINCLKVFHIRCSLHLKLGSEHLKDVLLNIIHICVLERLIFNFNERERLVILMLLVLGVLRVNGRIQNDTSCVLLHRLEQLVQLGTSLINLFLGHFGGIWLHSIFWSAHHIIQLRSDTAIVKITIMT